MQAQYANTAPACLLGSLPLRLHLRGREKEAYLIGGVPPPYKWQDKTIQGSRAGLRLIGGDEAAWYLSSENEARTHCIRTWWHCIPNTFMSSWLFALFFVSLSRNACFSLSLSAYLDGMKRVSLFPRERNWHHYSLLFVRLLCVRNLLRPQIVTMKRNCIRPQWSSFPKDKGNFSTRFCLCAFISFFFLWMSGKPP